MTHNFESSLENSFVYDAELDLYFSRWFIVREVGMEFQRAGIDRIFICKSTRRQFTVEYKSDSKAAQTGNAFVESISVDSSKKDGWALTCLSQYLVYYVPPQSIAYLIQVVKLKKAMLEWCIKYPERKSINERYNTLGILVPLREFGLCADKKIKITHNLRKAA